MNNLGKASVKVEILDQLPAVNRNPVKYNFDANAHQWDFYSTSVFFPPLLAECINDPELGSFAAIHPAKRKYYINNFIQFGNGQVNAGVTPTEPYIIWTPTSDKKGIVADIFDPNPQGVNATNNPNPYPDYTLIQPRTEYPANYNGPKWDDAGRTQHAPPNDLQTIAQWHKSMAKVSAGTIVPTYNTNVPRSEFITRNWINQKNLLDGLWWGVESNEFLQDNMPLWINILVNRTPATSTHETAIIISLGLDDEEQAYDIKLSHNNKPVIYDYYLGRNAASSSSVNGSTPSSGNATSVGVPVKIKEFPNIDLSRFLDSRQEIEIGLMTIAGRLILTVNQVTMVYTRIDCSTGDNAGKIKEVKIAKGKMRIYGTNVQAAINVCPMTFVPQSAIAIPLPTTINDGNNAPVRITYQGINNKGVIGGSVAKLPQQPDRNTVLYGVDCETFTDDNGSVSPRGVGFHQKGEIIFQDATSAGVTYLPNSDFYVLYLNAGNIDNFVNPLASTATTPAATFSIINGGCPYFFRIKGAYNPSSALIAPTVIDVPEVLNLTETMTAPDYFSATATASVVIYNKNGKYDYLKNTQYGVQISWGWESYDAETSAAANNISLSFTGVITSATSSETPGKETLTLQCEDYSFILKNTPIINSPFYDGMVAFNAIEDLAKRGGILNVENNINTPLDYFLPAGYTFTAPVMRYPQRNKLYECITDMTKRYELFVVFDEKGTFHVYGLPGGLFSTIVGVTQFSKSFVRDPSATDPSTIILNEKNVEYNFASTFNAINIMTLDRDTRNAIIYNKSATANEDHLVARRILLLDQPAYGDLEVARTYAERLGKRIFWPIKKTTFSTVGSDPVTNPKVLNFVKVDGQEFRILTVSKKYNAESNDYTVEYGAEWLGG